MLTGLTIILASLLAASPIPQTPARGVVIAASGSNITAALWQNFEGALDAAGLDANDHATGWTWSVTGAGKTVDPSAQLTPSFTINTTTDTGVQGLLIDNLTGSGVVQAEPPSYPNTTNVLFAFKITSMDDAATDPVAAWGENSSTDSICRFRVGRSGATYSVDIQAGTGADSSDITISAATWYFVTIQIVRNGTCLLRVYTTALVQVGAEVSVTGQDKQFFYHSFTGISASNTGSRLVDNYCVGSVFPLIP